MSLDTVRPSDLPVITEKCKFSQIQISKKDPTCKVARNEILIKVLIAFIPSYFPLVILLVLMWTEWPWRVGLQKKLPFSPCCNQSRVASEYCFAVRSLVNNGLRVEETDLWRNYYQFVCTSMEVNGRACATISIIITTTVPLSSALYRKLLQWRWSHRAADQVGSSASWFAALLFILFCFVRSCSLYSLNFVK